MNINLINKKGIKLNTANKYCSEDIQIVPKLDTITATPKETSQTINPSEGTLGFSSVIVEKIPDGYIIPSGTQSITSNGTYDVTEKASVVVSVDETKPEQEKVVDLAMATGNQIVIPDSGKVLTKVTVNKPSTLVASNIKTGVNIGGVVGTLSEGKEEQAKSVTLSNNNYTTDITPDSGKVLSKVSVTVNVPLQSKTTVPTKSQQIIKADAAYGGLSQVTVDAIPDEYIIPSGLQNITANGTYDVTEKASVVVNVDTAKPEQTKTVDLAMASGNQVVTPDSGKVLTQVTVKKPATLVAGNIKSGVSIGGVTGTLEAAKEEQTKTIEITSNGTTKITADSGKVLTEVTVTVNVSSEQPTLNAPTISLSDSTLTITNPATNGNFVTSYKVYDGETLVATVTTTTVDLSAYITTAGTHTITVKAAGTNFVDSAASNSASFVVVARYSITPTLTNVTAASGNATDIAEGETVTLTYTANDGYNLPDTVTVTGATGSWNKSSGTLTLSNATGNVTFTITGQSLPTLSTPTISLVSGTTIQIDSIDDNASTIEVYADGTKIGEVAKS